MNALDNLKRPTDVGTGGLVIPHVCRESTTCTCYQLALEPDEECPVHGWGEYPPRCGTCGRFLKRKPLEVNAV